MSNTQRRTQFLCMLATLIKFAEENYIELICADFFRTTARQKELFDEGKSKCDGTNIKSQHQRWLAADMYIVEDGKLITDSKEYTQLGMRWESMGGTWGGRWPTLHDIYHFELDNDDV